MAVLVICTLLFMRRMKMPRKSKSWTHYKKRRRKCDGCSKRVFLWSNPHDQDYYGRTVTQACVSHSQGFLSRIRLNDEEPRRRDL